MITFEPDSPWQVGQVVTFRENGRPPYRKVVVAVEESDDGLEAQYELTDLPDPVVALGKDTGR